MPGSSCLGVDLNRNFPEGYGIGASKDPCSEVYQGQLNSTLFIIHLVKSKGTWFIFVMRKYREKAKPG